MSAPDSSLRNSLPTSGRHTLHRFAYRSTLCISLVSVLRVHVHVCAMFLPLGLQSGIPLFVFYLSASLGPLRQEMIKTTRSSNELKDGETLMKS